MHKSDEKTKLVNEMHRELQDLRAINKKLNVQVLSSMPLKEVHEQLQKLEEQKNNQISTLSQELNEKQQQIDKLQALNQVLSQENAKLSSLCSQLQEKEKMTAESLAQSQKSSKNQKQMEKEELNESILKLNISKMELQQNYEELTLKFQKLDLAYKELHEASIKLKRSKDLIERERDYLAEQVFQEHETVTSDAPDPQRQRFQQQKQLLEQNLSNVTRQFDSQKKSLKEKEQIIEFMTSQREAQENAVKDAQKRCSEYKKRVDELQKLEHHKIIDALESQISNLRQTAKHEAEAKKLLIDKMLEFQQFVPKIEMLKIVEGENEQLKRKIQYLERQVLRKEYNELGNELKKEKSMLKSVK